MAPFLASRSFLPVWSNQPSGRPSACLWSPLCGLSLLADTLSQDSSCSGPPSPTLSALPPGLRKSAKLCLASPPWGQGLNTVFWQLGQHRAHFTGFSLLRDPTEGKAYYFIYFVQFLVVSGKKVNLVPATPSLLETTVIMQIIHLIPSTTQHYQGGTITNLILHVRFCNLPKVTQWSDSRNKIQYQSVLEAFPEPLLCWQDLEGVPHPEIVGVGCTSVAFPNTEHTEGSSRTWERRSESVCLCGKGLGHLWRGLYLYVTRSLALTMGPCVSGTACLSPSVTRPGGAQF